MDMHFLALQFASGRTFFVGTVLVCAACALSLRLGRRGFGLTLTVGAVAGGLLVLLSGTPLPLWAYGLWYLSLATCLIAAELPRLQRGRAHAVACGFLALTSAGFLAVEIPIT